MPGGAKISTRRAAGWLALATGIGAGSLPVMKALAQEQTALSPGVNSLYLAAVSVVARFGLSALVVAVWLGPRLGGLTRAEIWQGLGLGLFGGMGILWQMDGTLHIPASVAAFLTQCYCVLVPAFIAVRRRELPSAGLVLGGILVVAGISVLADFHLDQLKLDRGQAETVLASIFFTGQILWLSRPVFAANRVGPVSLIMFLAVAILVLPVAASSSHGTGEWRAVYQSGPAVGLTLFLALGCTLVPYVAMNFLQPRLSPGHASLVYASEPIFTALFALFLPGWLSRLGHVNYSNEILGWRVCLGGGLILSANLLLLREPVNQTDLPSAP